MYTLVQRTMAFVFVSAVAVLFAGCPSFGPAPQTVASVEVVRYMGLWHEIASNPQFFNKNLVAVTANYTLRDDGKVTVLNKGHEGTPDGPETSIEGVARVVDTATNSKLAVRFPSIPFNRLFEGQYWIVLLDEDYQHAVVTDSRQSTLFILARTPSLSRAEYDGILAELSAKQIDLSRLRITGTVVD